MSHSQRATRCAGHTTGPTSPPLACTIAAVASLLGVAACATEAEPSGVVEQVCQIATTATAPESLEIVGCYSDFQALASAKLDTSIPGARSVKVVYDRTDGQLYFQNSLKYQIHYDFAKAHLSGRDLPLVSALSEFNQSEYFSPERRFILGAVTHYEGPHIWAVELAPYDTASSEMILTLFREVKASVYFGPELSFHPTSVAVASEARSLPDEVPIRTTDDIYLGIDYQPLNLATATGRLRIMTAAELETTYVGYRDIVVLDVVPNDISVVSGIVTEEFQTPLSHINVLSRNRRTPNMGLKGATHNPTIRALEGAWVELNVGSFEWTLREVTTAEAEAEWAIRRPSPVVLPAVDTHVTELRNIEDVVVETATVPLRDAIKSATLAFGGKAAHYSVLAKTEGVPTPKAFAVPAFHYLQFMNGNGFFSRVDELLSNDQFVSRAEVRDAELAKLRAAIHDAPVDEAFQAALRSKLSSDYSGARMRFRSSTNSEDLEGFPCAGCYESHTGDPLDWDDVLYAIKDTWASIWLFRTFEERAYNGIDHKSVAMALLVHHSFPDEEANGVAVTSNPFDPSGLQPAFFVNVQFGGDVEVVHPPPGTTSDQILYFHSEPNQPVSYLSHSNLIPEGQAVLTRSQIHELGEALSAIHERFSSAYGPKAGNEGWYAMDVEFKFDGEAGQTARLAIKQARPYPPPS
ncbi:MAG: hypothetical protein HY795_18550 [Desulfovibrio sp.]|nr:hypothetical protein [Desulfovibrio sp.]